jgi:triosephosphate isomerase (TIM)
VYRGIRIVPPFFELGPKAYTYGDEMLEIAMRADEVGMYCDVQVIIDPQYVDIPVIAARMQHALVFAPHVDAIDIGRGQGAVLAEAVRAAGAVGALLNHVERRLSRPELARTIERADAVGLATMVCTDDVADAVEVAAMAPNIVVVESPESIGTGAGAGVSEAMVASTDAAIWRVNPDILILHGGGIGSAKDVYDVIRAGAQGTGSSSGVFRASNPLLAVETMIRAVREAWDARAAGPVESLERTR